MTDDTQDAAEGADAVQEPVQMLYAALLEDWARGDGASYGSRFTDDADYVTFDGTLTKGGAAIGAYHQQAFDTFLAGSRLLGRITAIRVLATGVALVHATADTLMSGEAGPAPERASIQTLIAVSTPHAWRFTAFQNTRISS